ncbi:LysR family transcriptional regulator [Sphingomonas sp. SRS2]|uniref:LysR family transcriptional regulator n=1 Tax=Sphingomonas sp. SRS2 TaxID=133190 RepID=UPI0006184B4E|nr:LysR family transcriptional regulator [Sphingomonas sp. SRS2]KKC27992.1 hypothetical protein WP12_00265 [Sphingomonas sp. SRS2]
MLTSLRYFAEVVDRRSFTAAAEALNVSQPTLTRSLQNLEFRLDCTLILRDKGNFELTPAGSLLLSRGRMLLAEQKSILGDLAALNTHQKGQVTVNGSLVTSLHLLPKIFQQLAVTRPDLRVSIVGANDADYERKRAAVLSGEVDVAFSLYDPANSAEGLVQEMLIEPHLKIMVRRGHPANRPDCDIETLLQYPWVMLPGTSNKTTIETEFRMKGLAFPDDVVRVSEWRFALDLLEVSDHVAVVPYHPALFTDHIKNLVVLPLEFSVRPLAICILSRPLGSQRGPTRDFIDAVKATVKDAETKLG